MTYAEVNIMESYLLLLIESFFYIKVEQLLILRTCYTYYQSKQEL